MKGKFINGLEKIVEVSKDICENIKKNGKIVLTTLALPLILNSNTIASVGRLDTQNYIGGDYVSQRHRTIHRTGVSEGYDSKDIIYFGMFNPSGIASKIVSIVEEKELDTDCRPVDSNSSINLELSLHSQSGSPITISSANILRGSLPFSGPPYFYDFGSKPITYWERDIEDPNVYYLVANIRKEILQNGGVIPLPDLNGTYGSQVPYLYAQIRFNDHFVHLNEDDIVDLKDYAIFANAFGREGITNTNRADPNDIGAWADYDLDGNIDLNDLSIFTDYYLTSKKYHLEDGWILE